LPRITCRSRCSLADLVPIFELSHSLSQRSRGRAHRLQ
jgi:hypothetical protein